MAGGNRWYQKKLQELCQMFGACCALCGKKNGDYIDNASDKTVILHFAHKVGHRFPQGNNRGQNHRVREIMRAPHSFILLCWYCHIKYDKDNSLTDEEREAELEEVPF